MKTATRATFEALVYLIWDKVGYVQHGDGELLVFDAGGYNAWTLAPYNI